MEMMFALIGALAIGLSVRYSMSGRDRTGAVMIPALATATGALVWAIGIWGGLASTDPWIWLLTFALSGIVSYLVNRRVTRVRTTTDNAVFGRIARH
jgi:hypothetical protein